jgi:crotonobetaine/carnitine-CoA ligase
MTDSKRTVAAVLRDAAARHPQRTALRVGSTGYSYSEIHSRARRMASALTNLGLRRGDPLLIMLPNRIEFVDVWLAASLLGIVEIPVNTESRGEMLRYVIKHSGASVMVIDATYLERLDAIAEDVGFLGRLLIVGDGRSDSLDYVSLDSAFEEAEEAEELPELEEHDPIAIMYTSGTTGPAKGALIAHRHAYEYAHSVVSMLEIGGGDVYYAPLPLFHIAGQWATVYAAFQAGATALLTPRFSVGEFWNECRDEGVTVTFLLGAMAQLLYGQPAAPDDAEAPVDRVLMVPLIRDLEGFRSRFGVRVTTCYASTEVNVPIVATFDATDPGCAGKAARGYELRIVDEHDNDVELGRAGELLVRSPEPWMTMIGYHANAEATASAMRNLWLHSGDAFRQDEDGNLYFVDRIKDAIRRRGENISSFEVEREVIAYPQALECAAVAAPSELTEDEVRIFVVPKPDATIDPDDLRAFLKARMPRYMVPKYIEIVDALPKTQTGKIQKHVLREKPLEEGTR